LDRCRSDHGKVRACNAAAVLREKLDALGAEEVELLRRASLVERAVGAGDRAASRAKNERERQHAAAADPAKEIVPVSLHRRMLQSAPGRHKGTRRRGKRWARTG